MKATQTKVEIVPNALVFDFETASLKRNGAILSIGAFMFDRFSVENTKAMKEDPKYRFSVNIDLTEQFFLGFDIDWETGRWWRERNADQIQEVLNRRISISSAINKFNQFLKGKDLVIYCRHTHADFTWYENACLLLGIKPTIRFNRIFDVSTTIFTKFNEIKGYIPSIKRGIAHNALEDSMHDALQIAACFDPAFKIDG